MSAKGKTFPKDFIFGGSTAAYQVEGATREDGRGPCSWDEDMALPGSRFTADPASDFYHKYPEDFALCEQFGVKGIRISLSWTRILPEGEGRVNQKGIDYYNKLIDACIAHGVEPFVTLHHFDTPLAYFHAGGWENRALIDHFVDYARVCFEAFGDRVRKWATFNEPWSIAQNGYIAGNFPPHHRFELGRAIQIEHNLMVAHARALHLYKTMHLPGKIGIVHTLEGKVPITDTPENRHARDLDDAMSNRFMLDACFHGGYDAETRALIDEILEKNGSTLVTEPGDFEAFAQAAKEIDFLGMNYYSSHFLKAWDGESQVINNSTGEKGTSVFALKGVGARVSNPAVPTTDWDWPIYPQGMHDQLVRVHRDYPTCKEIFIAENGMGYKDDFVDGKIDDTPRIEYVAKHLAAVHAAIAEGVPVKGYYIWSLQDMLSWSNGYNKPNQEELAALLGHPVETAEDALQAARTLSRRGVRLVCVSLGAAGSIACEADACYRVRVPKIDCKNPVGFGDSFVAGAATALARGDDTQSILRLAAACGTANALEAESGFVRPDVVRALLPQSEITPITI